MKIRRIYPMGIDQKKSNKKEIILITGGSGLIGTRLAQIIKDQYTVIGLDLSPNVHPDKEIENIGFDITDDKSIEDAFERIKSNYSSQISSIVHLAAYYDFNGKESPMYKEITVKGTERLLKLIKKHFNLQQFIFSSTNLVYKPCEPGEKIDEKWPLEPNWAYPKSKVETEKIIKEYKGDTNVVIARIAGAYDGWGHSIPVSHQIERIYNKDLTGYLYSGDKNKGNAFIHLDDLLIAIKKIIENRNKLKEYEVINISEGKTYSYNQLQDRIGQLIHGKEWKTFEIPKPIAKAGAAARDIVGDPFIKPWMIDRADDHYQMDISKAKNAIQWEPEHDIFSDLEAMIQNLHTDPEKWFTENNLEIPKSLK